MKNENVISKIKEVISDMMHTYEMEYALIGPDTCVMIEFRSTLGLLLRYEKGEYSRFKLSRNLSNTMNMFRGFIDELDPKCSTANEAKEQLDKFEKLYDELVENM